MRGSSNRTRETLQQDRNRLINRLKGLMTTQGLALPIGTDCFDARRHRAVVERDADPRRLKARLQRVSGQLDFLNTALEELDAARAGDPETTMGRYLTALPTLRGIRPVRTWTLTTELFGWREIAIGVNWARWWAWSPPRIKAANAHTIRALRAAGNRHVRRVMVQLAWGWLRYQPDSALTEWCQRKFGSAVPGCGA